MEKFEIDEVFFGPIQRHLSNDRLGLLRVVELSLQLEQFVVYGLIFTHTRMHFSFVL